MISDSLDLLISLQGGKVRYKFFVVNNASLADTCPGFDGNCKNSCFASRVVETPEIEIHTLDYLTARAIAHNWVGSGPQGAGCFEGRGQASQLPYSRLGLTPILTVPAQPSIRCS